MRCWLARVPCMLLLLLWEVTPFAPISLRRGCCRQRIDPRRQESFVSQKQQKDGQVLSFQPCRAAHQQQQVWQGRPSAPLVARAYARILKWGMGSILAPLGFGQMEGLSVQVTASSNWSVAMGRIDELRIRCDRIRSSPIIQISRGFDLQGNQLRLGIAPAACLLAPPLFLLYLTSSRIRSLLRIPVFFACLSVMTGVRPVKLMRKWLPSSRSDTEKKDEKRNTTVLTYRLALSGEDLSAKNTVVRMTLRRAMESLLRNSVVGVALSTAAAAASTDVGKTQEQQLAEMLAALEDNQSATTIELKKVTIEKGSKLLFDAAATFPQPGAALENEKHLTSTLDFVIRAKVAPLEEKRFRLTNASPAKEQLFLPGKTQAQSGPRPDRCGVMISDAEVKASFTKETEAGTIVPLEAFGRPIPDLWFPLGSGTAAFPFGSGHRVTTIVTQRGSDDPADEDRIDVCGEIYVGRDAPVLKTEWKMPFSKPISQSDDSSFPPPPPPPRRLGSSTLPILPPSS